jgi:hypothetical protein
MIPDPRTRQPRDAPMQCGSQPADISVIHRRMKLPCLALPIRCSQAQPPQDTLRMHKTASIIRATLDKQGPYQRR